MSLNILERGRRLHIPRYGVVAAVILALIGAIIVASLRQAVPQSTNAVATVALSRGTVKETYSATGELVPQSVETLNAMAPGTVTSVSVKAGQQVSAHQTLLTISSSSLSQSITSAQQTLQSDESKVALLESPLTAQQAALKITIAQDAVNTAQSQLAADAAKASTTSPAAGTWTTSLTEGASVSAGEKVGSVGGQTVTASTSGTVSALNEENGAAVSSGTVLFSVTNFSLKATLDSDRLALVNAQIALQQTQQQYSSSALAAQLSQAQSAVTGDKSSLVKLLATAQQLVVRAPFSGVVTTVSVTPGSPVSSGAKLLQLDSRQLEMSFPVSQAQKSVLALGQPAQVNALTVTALGHISQIGYVGTYSGGVSTFPVVVSLPTVSGLQPGMAAQATITVKSVSSGYVVPLEALHQKGNRTTVWVKTGTTHASIPVTVLLTNSLDASIESSQLKVGTPIIIATAASGTTTKLHVKGKPAHPGHGHHGKP